MMKSLRPGSILLALLYAGFIVATAVHHDPDPRHWV